MNEPSSGMPGSGHSGAGYGWSPAPQIEKPDWCLWAFIPRAMLWEVVALSCDIAPESLAAGASPPPEFERRKKIAVAHYGSDMPYVLHAHVSLTDFSAWSDSIGLDLPESFPRQKPRLSDELPSDTRTNLLRTIGALALLLIEKQEGTRFGTRRKPNKSAIHGAINSVLTDMGASAEGQGKSHLSSLLSEAIEVAMKKEKLPPD